MVGDHGQARLDGGAGRRGPPGRIQAIVRPDRRRRPPHHVRERRDPALRPGALARGGARHTRSARGPLLHRLEDARGRPARRGPPPKDPRGNRDDPRPLGPGLPARALARRPAPSLLWLFPGHGLPARRDALRDPAPRARPHHRCRRGGPRHPPERRRRGPLPPRAGLARRQAERAPCGPVSRRGDQPRADRLDPAGRRLRQRPGLDAGARMPRLVRGAGRLPDPLTAGSSPP